MEKVLEVSDMNKFGWAPEYESQPPGGTINWFQYRWILELCNNLVSPRTHWISLGTKEAKELPVVFFSFQTKLHRSLENSFNTRNIKVLYKICICDLNFHLIVFRKIADKCFWRIISVKQKDYIFP